MPRSSPSASAATSRAARAAALAHAPGAETERGHARAVGKRDGRQGVGSVAACRQHTESRGMPATRIRGARTRIIAAHRRFATAMPTRPAARRVVRGACPHDCPDTCAMLVTVEDGRADRRSAARRTIRRPAACCARRSRATSSARTPTSACCTRCSASAARAKAASSASAGTRRSTTIADALRRDRRVGRRPAGDRARTATPARWACCSTARWTAASSTGSARRCSTARSARRPARPAGSRRSARRWAPTSSSSTNSRLILIWGSNPIASNLHFWTRAQEAKRRGAKLIAIDPYRSATAEKCHEHIALLPGTDAALALGHDARADRRGPRRPRLRRPPHASASTRSRARGREYPPERVAAICGIAAASRSSRSPATTARTRPAAIRLNYGMQRHAGGGNAVRAIACLPALVGAWRDPAGGALLSSSGTYPVDTAALERPTSSAARRARST